MEAISKMIKAAVSRHSEMSTEEYMKQQLEFARSARGDGSCEKCNGLGLVPELIDGYIYYRPCECSIRETNMRRLKKSGLSDLVDRYTLDRFETAEEWQKRLKQSAVNFLSNPEGWFFVGGQVGCGKTHICTAILVELMKKGYESRYIVWPNEIIKLKANKNDDTVYSRIIGPLQISKVLYIDDFFKTAAGAQNDRPSASDIKTAFEILNYRYNNRGSLITIISTEKNIDDIIDYDEALGSRIYEMSRGVRNIIKYDKSRNYRLKREA